MSEIGEFSDDNVSDDGMMFRNGERQGISASDIRAWVADADGNYHEFKPTEAAPKTEVKAEQSAEKQDVVPEEGEKVTQNEAPAAEDNGSYVNPEVQNHDWDQYKKGDIFDYEGWKMRYVFTERDKNGRVIGPVVEQLDEKGNPIGRESVPPLMFLEHYKKVEPAAEAKTEKTDAREGELDNAQRIERRREKILSHMGDKYSLSDERADNGEAFIQNEEGSTNLAKIPDEIFDRIGIAPVPFKMTETMGWHVYDHHHIEAKLQSVSDAVDFVLSIINNVDHVRLGRDNSYIFSVENKRDKIGRRAVTIMINSKTGEFMGIKTSGYESINKLHERPLLWERGADAAPEDVATPTITTIEPQQGDERTSRTKGQSNVSSEGKVNDITPKTQGKSEKSSANEGETLLSEKIKEASADVNTEPTEAQKEAGNYKKGHVQVGTFDITIEQPEGSVRRGTDADGKKWESKMHNAYGYFKGTEGVDGDHIDVFLSNDIDGWDGHKVFVVDQYNPDGTFDEHKVMLGFNDAEEAKGDYLSNYEEGWEKGRRIDVTPVNLEDFEKWIESSHRKTKPFSEYAGVKKSETITPEQEALLGRPNSDQYPAERELSADKGTKKNEKSKSTGGKTKEPAKKVGEKVEIVLDEVLAKPSGLVVGARGKNGINIYDFVVKGTEAKIHAVMSGVNYADGIAVASDGHILLAIKTDYIKEYEGKAIDKKGNTIATDQRFPKWKGVIHTSGESIDLEAFIAAVDEATSKQKRIKELKAEYEKRKKVDAYAKPASDEQADALDEKWDGNLFIVIPTSSKPVILKYESALAIAKAAKSLKNAKAFVPNVDKYGDSICVAGDGAVAMSMGVAGVEEILTDETAPKFYAGGKVKESPKTTETIKEKAPKETVSPSEKRFGDSVVPDDADANIRQKLETRKAAYKKVPNRTRGFITNISVDLGLEQHEASQYGEFTAKNGKKFTFRISNHNTDARTFDENGEDEGISLVISSKKNKGIRGKEEAKAHVKEFFYPKKAIENAEGKPLATIIESIEDMLDTGEYVDKTGLAKPDETNAPKQAKVEAKKLDNGEITDVREHKADGVAPLTREERLLRDVEIEHARAAGLDVITDEEGQRVLDLANEGSELSKGLRLALDAINEETGKASTANENDSSRLSIEASSDSDAKVDNRIELPNDYKEKLSALAKRIENGEEISPEDFLLAIEEALGSQNKNVDSSQYFKGKEDATLRLANHRGSATMFLLHDHTTGNTSVVVKMNERKSRKNDKVDLKEFVYFPDKMDADIQKDIVSGLQEWGETGEYNRPCDQINVSTRKEGVRLMRVYHGSGADFDAFDHSHMGEGEGAQAYGHGVYVASDKGYAFGYTSLGYVKSSEELSKAARTEDEKWLYGYLDRSTSMFGRKGTEAIQHGIRMAQRKLSDLRWEEENMGKDHQSEIAQKERELKILQSAENGEIEMPHSYMYTVEIPKDTGSNYLNWVGKIPEGLKDKVKSDVDKIFSNIKQVPTYEEGKAKYIKDQGISEADFEDHYKRMMLQGIDKAGNVGELYRAIGTPKVASELLSSYGYTGIKALHPVQRASGRRSAKDYEYVIFNEADAKITDKVRFFRTANGEAYGFTVGGKIYIDTRIANAETPVHEYAHMWASVLRANNPQEWSNIVELMKGSGIWDEVKERYPELKTDDEFADEVLAHYSGRRGAERLREEARKIAEGNGSMFEKAEAISALERVKSALKAFWKGVCDFLHIHYTSAEEVADRVMHDFLGGVDPRQFGEVDGGLRMSEDEEIKEIIAKAKADGTYMKAPNGKPTNLNERQWAQVRTKAFKKWFGDWLMAFKWMRIKSLKATQIENRSVSEEDAQKAYENIGVIKNAIDGKYVDFVKSSFGKIVRHKGVDTKKIMDKLDVLFRESLPLFFEKEVAKEGHKDHSSNFVGYHHYLNKITIDGKEYYVRFTAQEIKTNPAKKKSDDFTPYQFHNTSISDIDIYESTESSVESPGTFPVTGTDRAHFDAKLANFLNDVRKAYENSSKVVDENGEPKVIDGIFLNLEDATPIAESERAIQRATRFAERIRAAEEKTGLSHKRTDFYYTDEGSAVNEDMFHAPDYIGVLCDYILDSGKTPELKVCFRYGGIRDNMRSFNYRDNTFEKGVSVVGRVADLNTEKSRFYEAFFGDENNYNVVLGVDTGSSGADGETLLRPAYVIGNAKDIGNFAKSATDNVGTFDANNNDIRFQFVGEKGAANADHAEEVTTRIDNFGVDREIEDEIKEKYKLSDKEKDDATKRIDERIADLHRRSEEDSSHNTVNGNLAEPLSQGKYSPTGVGVQGENPHTAKLPKGFKSSEEIARKLSEFVLNLSERKDVNAENFTKKLVESFQPSTSQESDYVHYIAHSGDRVTIRLSDHNGNARNIIIMGKKSDVGYSFVVRTPNTKTEDVPFRANKWAKVLEFVYKNPNKERLEQIAKGIFDLVDNGEYTDLAGADEIHPSPRRNSETASDEGELFRTSDEIDAEYPNWLEGTTNEARKLTELLYLDNIDFVPDGSAFEGKKARAKGWYSRSTGRITVVVGNHTSVGDIMQTVLHEAVAHYGLRKMFGEHFDNFLDSVYNNADGKVREAIDALAGQYNGNIRTATEEYLASLAENTNFEEVKGSSWWNIPLTDEDTRNMVDVLNQTDGILYGIDKNDGLKLLFFLKDVYNLLEVCNTKMETELQRVSSKHERKVSASVSMRLEPPCTQRPKRLVNSFLRKQRYRQYSRLMKTKILPTKPGFRQLTMKMHLPTPKLPLMALMGARLSLPVHLRQQS